VRIYYLGFRTTAWGLNVDQKMVRQISMCVFVCVCVNLSEMQNYARKQVCSQSSEKNEDGGTFCNTMVTCHET